MGLTMELVPSWFLKQIADKCKVSNAEFEVLSLALHDNSIQKISDQLDGLSITAVRQRLRQVYRKFEIDGDGRQKFAKLQKKLVSLYQEHQQQTRMKKVLILWSSEGKQIAESLKNTIFQHEQIEAWVSGEDIALDKNRFQKSVEHADFVICCLTRSSSIWLNFKVGFILGRNSKIKVLKVNKLTGPLANLAHLAHTDVINGTDKEQITNLLTEILSDKQKAIAWVDRTFDKWDKLLNDLIHDLDISDLNEDINSVKEATESLKENPYIRNNKCFREIFMNSLTEISGQLQSAHASYSVPATLYPYHLISLQKQLNVRVKAIALVDHEEHFWPEEIGRKIGDSAQKDSIRVFVFFRSEDLERNFEIILDHANEYEVRAMNYQQLIRELPPHFCKDFSIIEAPDNSKVLAEYVGRGLSKTICFTAHNQASRKVFIHEKALDKIIANAVKIEKNNSQNPETINKLMIEIREQIFKSSLSSAVGMKPIEMSAYIDVEDYDKHEEKHAYYQEMMNEMIDIIIEHQSKSSQLYRILELGAGTGIFTKRLLERISNIEVVAVELDWVCFHRLKHSLQNNNLLQVINDDSCTYVDPLGKKFDCIVSSFADHHIKPADKEHYFQNIKRNLAFNGIIVVGDEFLPSYDSDDYYARQLALEKYHQHIIEIAELEGETVLANLERAALKSGLEGVGDFKVSCEEYEAFLSASDLKAEKEKIGPKDRDDLGGVYVYKMNVADDK